MAVRTTFRGESPILACLMTPGLRVLGRVLPALLLLSGSVAGEVCWAQPGNPAEHSAHQHGSQGHDPHGSQGHAGHQQAGRQHGDDKHGDLNAAGFHHDFSDAERWARIFDSPERPEWQRPEEVMALMGMKPGMTVADIGAGTGFFLGYLAASVGDQGQVWALDVADSLVEHMSQRAQEAGWSNVRAQKIPFDSPGLAAGSVDRILIVNTWHHIDARADYSAKLLQALGPGGAVYVVDYTLESEHGPPKAHRLAPEQVVAELKAGGLEAAIVEEKLPRQYVVRAWRPAGAVD